MATVTELKKRQSDVFRSAIDKAYQVVSAKLKNNHTATISVTRENMIGMPVKKVGSDWLFLRDGDEGNVGGLVFPTNDFAAVSGLAANASTEHPFAIIVRGQAVINSDFLPDNDIEGNPFDKAALATALLAKNPPIVSIDDDGAQESVGAF